MKCCKVIVTYINDGRYKKKRNDETYDYPRHDQDIESIDRLMGMIHDLMTYELSLDEGLRTDTYIINNLGEHEEGNEFLRTFHGREKKQGNIFVLERPNDGGSFAAYNYAFQRMKNDYDYWLFTEDDIFVGGSPGYYNELIERFHQARGTGFLAIAGISAGRRHPFHAHGGVGLTSKKILFELQKKYGELAHTKAKGWDYGKVTGEGEVYFTHRIMELGYKLTDVSETKLWGAHRYCYPYGMWEREVKPDLMT